MKQRHVIDDIKYARRTHPGYVRCSCGWEANDPAAFAEHRKEAGTSPAGAHPRATIADQPSPWREPFATPKEEAKPMFTAPPRDCTVCGTTFTPQRAHPGRMPTMCSDACRNKAKNAPRAAAAAARASATQPLPAADLAPDEHATAEPAPDDAPAVGPQSSDQQVDEPTRAFENGHAQGMATAVETAGAALVLEQLVAQADDELKLAWREMVRMQGIRQWLRHQLAELEQA